jgi:hypothetical protein
VITLLKLTPYADTELAASPNHDARKSQGIEGIILHATQDGGNEAQALEWLRAPKSGVSCHLLVSRNGLVTRLVGDRERAWHAGISWWRGTADVNSITLGIEIANRNDGEPYTDAQYRIVAEIVAHYCRQGIVLDDVISHGAVAEDRRSDPFGWDWDRFRAMVEDQLRPPGAEGNGRRWVPYDRRGGERASTGASSDRSTGAEPKPQLAAMSPPKMQTPAAPAKKQQTTLPPKSAACACTLWLNWVTVLAAAGMLVAESLDLASSVGLTIPEEVTMWALFAVGLVNIILRLQSGGAKSIVPPRIDGTTRVPGRSQAIEKARAASRS